LIHVIGENITFDSCKKQKSLMHCGKVLISSLG
jgi:hypothetical protein